MIEIVMDMVERLGENRDKTGSSFSNSVPDHAADKDMPSVAAEDIANPFRSWNSCCLHKNGLEVEVPCIAALSGNGWIENFSNMLWNRRHPDEKASVNALERSLRIQNLHEVFQLTVTYVTFFTHQNQKGTIHFDD